MSNGRGGGMRWLTQEEMDRKKSWNEVTVKRNRSGNFSWVEIMRKWYLQYDCVCSVKIDTFSSCSGWQTENKSLWFRTGIWSSEEERVKWGGRSWWMKSEVRQKRWRIYCELDQAEEREEWRANTRKIWKWWVKTERQQNSIVKVIIVSMNLHIFTD